MGGDEKEVDVTGVTEVTEVNKSDLKKKYGRSNSGSTLRDKVISIVKGS